MLLSNENGKENILNFLSSLPYYFSFSITSKCEKTIFFVILFRYQTQYLNKTWKLRKRNCYLYHSFNQCQCDGLGKVGYNSLVWKNIEKRTPNFINQFYLHPFKNILKYIHFFKSNNYFLEVNLLLALTMSIIPINK